MLFPLETSIPAAFILSTPITEFSNWRTILPHCRFYLFADSNAPARRFNLHKSNAAKVIELEIKVLNQATIQKINEGYRKRSIATDKKGQPYIANGEVVYKVEKDSGRAVRHIIAEAPVYPNLKDPELMKFFECQDITEMALKVFPRADEYAHVSRVVMAALGMGPAEAPQDDDSEVNDAKN